MEEALRHLLQSAAGPGIVHLPGAEVSWIAHPQGAPLPGVVLSVVAGAEGLSQQGPNGLLRAVVQIDVYDPDAGLAIRLGREIAGLLNGHRGDAELGGFFEGIFLTSTRQGRESGTNEADRPFRISMDFDMNWRTT